MKRILAVCLQFIAMPVFSQSTLSIGATTLQVDTVFSGLDIPWQLIYGPDDHLWITERKGIISRIDPVNKTKTVILDISASVYTKDESGMLGMALHPDFSDNNELFVVYTYSSSTGAKERLVKYTYSNNLLSNQVVILDNVAATNAHNGSRLLFLPDKTLLMTTGDAHVASAPQDINDLNGKVLRINTDGSVPADNPFPGKYTYTYGHRNAQGMCMGPGNTIYISEHGPSTDDEFQVLEAGRNYGWPDVEGFCDLPQEITFCNNNNVKEPIIDWTPTIAPAGMIYYTNNSFPELDERFLLATLKTKKIVAIKLNSTGTASITENSYLVNMFGRLRDICYGKQKELYIATNGPEAFNNEPNTHSILRLRPPMPVVSVEANNEPDNFLIYPSLAYDFIILESGRNLSDGMNYYINDITGICRMHGKLSHGITTIGVENLANGLYFLILEKKQERIGIRKFCKSGQ